MQAASHARANFEARAAVVRNLNAQQASSQQVSKSLSLNMLFRIVKSQDQFKSMLEAWSELSFAPTGV